MGDLVDHRQGQPLGSAHLGPETPLQGRRDPVRSVALVGSTGSIGRQAVDILAANPDRFSVESLSASSSIEELARQAKALRPRYVGIADESLAGELSAMIPPGIEVVAGKGALVDLAGGADVVLNAVVGFAGLEVTIAALRASRRLALANKESLVAGGPVVQAAWRTGGAEIVPVDSEHCALHQCLRSGRPEEVSQLVLTGSGGPLRGRSGAELETVTKEVALAHPTWQMGPKITIDSSTLMNKGLEVIEAHELFGVPYDQIAVVIHPQSIVHSMIDFTDGSTLAQLSMPDMRLPIGYALGYPTRLESPSGRIDFETLSRLDFEQPDRKSFACLDLAYQAGRAGGSAPAWLNAANEIAVTAFLEDRLEWIGIAEVVEETLQAWDRGSLVSVEDVVAADATARRHASEMIHKRGRPA